MLELVDELRTIVPNSLDGFFFSNSGAEAVEGALKLARHATGRPNVIVFHGSFHGRTVATMTMTTSKTIYKNGYQPLMPGVFVSPYPYALKFGWDEEKTSQWCLDELELLLQSQTAPSETAAIFIEPVLGEGGYVVPPPLSCAPCVNFAPGTASCLLRMKFNPGLEEPENGSRTSTLALSRILSPWQKD